MDAFQEDITELRNFKQRNNLSEMVVHFHESCFLGDSFLWTCVADFISKLSNIRVSYMLGGNDFEVGLYPLVTANSLYLIEFENDGDDCLKQIEYLKKRVMKIKDKLSSDSFIKKAPLDIVNLEKRRLLDFEKRWQLASMGYTFV